MIDSMTIIRKMELRIRSIFMIGFRERNVIWTALLL